MRTHLVTGGSYGIGHALVRSLLDQGDEVYSLSRSCPKDITSPNHHWMPVNFGMEAFGNSDLYQKLATERVVLDTITINAAVQERKASQWDLNQWLRHMDINCFSQCELYEQLDREKLINEKHTVLVMGSVAICGSSWAPAYAMSKAALETYWECKRDQRQKALRMGLNVQIIYPGRVNTPGNPKRELDLTDPNPFKSTQDIIPELLKILNEKPSATTRFNVHDLGS